MLKVKQFRYGADNLGYLVYGAESAMAIDGGAADAILAFLAEHRLTLRYVANTHSHSDHTSGNGALLAGSQARLLTGADLSDGARIGLDAGADPDHPYARSYGGFLVLLYRQGPDCRGYPLQRDDRELLFGGSGGILPVRQEADGASRRDTGLRRPRLCPGFAGLCRRLEPENRAIGDFLARYDPQHVVSTIAEEKRINPYFRFNEPGIVNLLAKRGLPRQTEWERWQSLMSIE